jgi:ribose transport system substrate-binding protein
MRIAVFTKNRSNPAYGAARLGADRAAARLGARTAHYVPQKDDDPEEQSALVLRALGERPDAIVFAPVHPVKVRAAIEAIHAAGVPVFGFVNPLPGGRAVTYVGSDDHALALAAAKYLYRYLAGSGRVLLLSGPADSVTSIPRMRAFEEAAAQFPGIGIAGVCLGHYNREKARAAVAEWLRGGASLDACLSANDVMALGALDALREGGRNVAVVGVNAIPEAIVAIKAGEMLASADFNAMRMCQLATECAVRHLRGERVPEKIELPVEIVDRGNYHRWDLPFEERPLPTLAETLGTNRNETGRERGNAV